MNISKKTVSLPMVIIMLVLVAAASFFGGTFVNKSKGGMPGQSQIGSRQGNQISANGTASKKTTGIQMINGEITAIDNSSLTVKTQNGSSQIILLSSSTAYKQMADASKTDMIVGKSITVTGTKDNSGSISATQVSTGVEVSNGGPQGDMPQGDQPAPQN